ncbi:hypothetical protein LZC95_00695 [Pendulispora brunnea]|uniref:Uncharacterized protein n=1 Tax=Pendulispora brunnea TaxID=2905690 RepID=A0ABZ2K9J2_9BACT
MTSRPWMPFALAFAFATALVTTARPAAARNCFDDRDCAAPTPACNAGQCAECSATNQGQCSGRSPACVLPAGICGCENDGQCGNATSGLLCTRPAPASGSAPYCRSGCATGRNGCDTDNGYACNNGQCTKLCALGAQCTSPPRDQCRLLVLTLTCLECEADQDCAAKPGATVCDTTSHSCVQCNVDTDCQSSPHGRICRGGNSPQRSCGCNSDTDCGADRICDETVKVCVDGCRIPGGGQCPPGNHCFAGDDGGSACVPIDGGTGTGDGGTGPGDGSTGDAGDAGGSRDAGARDAGRTDGGGGGGGGNPGDFSLEGGGWSCAMSPAEDALPIGGILAVGGLLAFFARRRPRR